MNSQLLQKVEKEYINDKLPEVRVGDTIEVSTVIREGDKQRIQNFKGLVIGIKGSGTRKTVTVRKISNGVGVEKIFAIHSPNVAEVKILKHGSVRRSKLYYMRDRVGKQAMKVKKGDELEVIEEESQIAVPEEVSEVAPEAEAVTTEEAPAAEATN